jgi:hypothetical protein
MKAPGNARRSTRILGPLARAHMAWWHGVGIAPPARSWRLRCSRMRISRQVPYACHAHCVPSGTERGWRDSATAAAQHSMRSDPSVHSAMLNIASGQVRKHTGTRCRAEVVYYSIQQIRPLRLPCARPAQGQLARAQLRDVGSPACEACFAEHSRTQASGRCRSSCSAVPGKGQRTTAPEMNT